MEQLCRRLLSGHFVLALAVVAFCLAGPESASARRNGVVEFSGKQGASCNSCHFSCFDPADCPEIVAPEVRFEGPAEVALGETAEFRFIVVSGSEIQSAAGFNVAASAGDLNLPSDAVDTQKQGDELTHTRPKDNDGAGVASWDFNWTAPEAAGQYLLFGAGNSVDNNFDLNGDLSATAMVAVEVVAPATSTPTPEPTPTASPIPSCAGDCNGDGRVAIDELVLGVNIATGLAPLQECLAVGQASIADLVAAVGNALHGCP